MQTHSGDYSCAVCIIGDRILSFFTELSNTPFSNNTVHDFSSADSVHSLPTRSTNSLSRYPPSLSPTQPRHNSRKLLRRSYTMLQRRVRTYAVNDTRYLPIRLAQQLALNSSRRHTIDRSAIPTQLVRQMPCNRFEAGFTRRVNREALESLSRCEGRDVDYACGGGEVGRCGLDHEEGGLQVCGHY